MVKKGWLNDFLTKQLIGIWFSFFLALSFIILAFWWIFNLIKKFVGIQEEPAGSKPKNKESTVRVKVTHANFKGKRKNF